MNSIIRRPAVAHGLCTAGVGLFLVGLAVLAVVALAFAFNA
ncbi:MAG: hypothetical protein AAF668_07140 [Pseudomonadota bacterium]